MALSPQWRAPCPFPMTIHKNMNPNNIQRRNLFKTSIHVYYIYRHMSGINLLSARKRMSPLPTMSNYSLQVIEPVCESYAQVLFKPLNFS